MTENVKEEIQTTDITMEENKDTVSKLFDDRDRNNRDWDAHERPKVEEDNKTPAPQKGEEGLEAKAATAQAPKPDDKKGVPEDIDGQPSEADLLRKKLEKTEKVLVENQRYGRNNAQKVKGALKIAQKLTEDGLLAEEEAKELLATLQSEGGGTEEKDTTRYQATPFAPIFKVANKELQNILKYTDDEHLQDKVSAFDYFLSVGSKEEIEQVFEDLTELLDDPLKLARKMLSIGQDVYEESYKGICQAGGFKNYLSVKDQEIEKLQKKIDKLEKKLLQYEDFDKPRYRMDETGSPGMGDVSKPANDTISALFDERDGVTRR